MNRINISIQTFFYFFLVVSVAMPLLILGGESLNISSKILRKELLFSNKKQVSLIAEKIDQYLERPVNILQLIKRQMENEPSLSAESKLGIISSFVESLDILTGLQITDSEGIIQLLYPPDEFFIETDVSGYDYFKNVKGTGQVYWSSSSLSEQIDNPLSSISLPFGKGVITANLSLDKISSMLDDSNYRDLGLILYVTDQNGVYISHPDIQKVQFQEYNPRYIFYKMNDLHSLPTEEVYEGEKYAVYSEIIESSMWMVTLMKPVSSINAPVDAMRLALLVLTVFVLIVSILFNFIFRRSLAGPLQDLTSHMRRVSQGDYDIELPRTRIIELSQLGSSFKKMSREIRDREEALQNARTYLINVIDSMPSIIIGIDPELKVTQWNRQAELSTGLKSREVLGSFLGNIMPHLTDTLSLIDEAIVSGVMQVDSRRYSDTDGRLKVENIIIYPLLSGVVQGAVLRIDDVTEKVYMEEILIQNEKMLSIGGLAAGMAHEINNPLAGMIQTANVLSRRLGLKQPISSNNEAAEKVSLSLDVMHQYLELRDIPNMLNSINLSGKRISDIVNNMLSFVRNTEDLVSFHDINKIIDHSLDLAASDYNLKKKYDFKKIAILKEYSLELPMVLCEKTKIQQVFFNILQNGAHAMGEFSDGNPCFIIRTYLDVEAAMIVIEIEDNGPGMSEAVKKRIFEPFYTTKPVGVGTGLGMSVSYFIINENQNGELAVESRLGEGAKFIIKLPSEK